MGEIVAYLVVGIEKQGKHAVYCRDPRHHVSGHSDPATVEQNMLMVWCVHDWALYRGSGVYFLYNNY